MCALFEDLTKMREGGRPFTLVMKDPLAHSFLQNPYHPEPDQRVKKFFTKRTEEENEMLGLNDMKVDNYQEKSEK